MKNNFDYTIELISKMSDLIKPDFLKVMKREVKNFDQFHKLRPKYSKTQIIDKVVSLIKEFGIITSQVSCGSSCWLFAFNCNDRNIFMTACESNSGTSFRYKVNDFDEDDFNDTVNYIALIAMISIKELKQETNKE